MTTVAASLHARAVDDQVRRVAADERRRESRNHATTSNPIGTKVLSLR